MAPGERIGSFADSTDRLLVLSFPKSIGRNSGKPRITKAMKRNITRCAALTVLVAQAATAQINYSGGTYTENFNGIFNVDGTGTAVPGTTAIGLQGAIPTLTTWQAARVGGSGASTFAIFGDWGGSGASGTGRLYAYGLPTSSERALGAIASGTTIVGFGTWFVNTSPDTYGVVTISFDREIWRTQNTAIDQSLAFSYGLASSGIGTGNFITNATMYAYPSLNATSPSFYASLNGGLGGYSDPGTNSVNVTATIGGLNWAPGDFLFIRWNDANDAGNDAGVAIDNLSMVAAIPEPAVVGLFGLSVAVFALFRRKAS